MDNTNETIWLFGWENIVKYLGKSAKTVKRYARQGMLFFRDSGGRLIAKPYMGDEYILQLNRGPPRSRF